MIFTPPPCHKLSHFLRPLPPLERDILYGRPLVCKFYQNCSTYFFNWHTSRCSTEGELLKASKTFNQASFLVALLTLSVFLFSKTFICLSTQSKSIVFSRLLKTEALETLTTLAIYYYFVLFIEIHNLNLFLFTIKSKRATRRQTTSGALRMCELITTLKKILA